MRQDGTPVDGSFAVLYEELRRLAHGQLRRAGGRATLSTTAVVHETYLKLASASAQWQDHQHFLSLAARAMRQVVVDYARSQAATKRGGDLRRVELNDETPDGELPLEELLAIERGLQLLEREDERLAKVVELRFFAGLTHAEIATALAISERSVEREWRRARAFLLAALKAEPGGKAGTAASLDPS
ncbi:MAG TPA: ECF-type sigma factor [Thermoanaerobaculia bacterium]|jgi:RNA polymerase sigma factor (TIGR02999 family)|nr:ECF-type sigma factor [Thermoanaerobaculia bacterium]